MNVWRVPIFTAIYSSINVCRAPYLQTKRALLGEKKASSPSIDVWRVPIFTASSLSINVWAAPFFTEKNAPHQGEKGCSSGINCL